jgi:hypothetical protein
METCALTVPGGSDLVVGLALFAVTLGASVVARRRLYSLVNGVCQNVLGLAWLIGSATSWGPAAEVSWKAALLGALAGQAAFVGLVSPALRKASRAPAPGSTATIPTHSKCGEGDTHGVQFVELIGSSGPQLGSSGAPEPAEPDDADDLRAFAHMMATWHYTLAVALLALGATPGTPHGAIAAAFTVLLDAGTTIHQAAVECARDGAAKERVARSQLTVRGLVCVLSGVFTCLFGFGDACAERRLVGAILLFTQGTTAAASRTLLRL